MNGSVVNGESRNVNSKETLANIEACINAVASSTDEMGANAKLPPKDENGSLETKLPAKLPSDLYETIEKIKKVCLFLIILFGPSPEYSRGKMTSFI